MSRKKPRGPTDSELEILQVLWQHGPCTVRQVQENLARGDSLRYTTVLKTMQVMTEKELVRRDEQTPSHIYRAAVKQSAIQRKVVRDVIDKVFGGSAANMAMQALTARRSTSQELQELREMIDDIEGRSR